MAARPTRRDMPCPFVKVENGAFVKCCLPIQHAGEHRTSAEDAREREQHEADAERLRDHE